MIRLFRQRDRIGAGFLGQRKRTRERRLFEQRRVYLDALRRYEAAVAAAGPTTPLPRRPEMAFEQDKWGQAKDLLMDEAHRKCAYCEWEIGESGQIDHFRPRALYWWLAYCHDNLIWSCTTCHGASYKGDEFSVAAARMADPFDAGHLTCLAPSPADEDAIAEYHAACRAEAPRLVDPYLVDPVEFIAWDADDKEKEVRAKARENVAGAAEVVDALDECLGVNREALARARYRTYESLKEDVAILRRHRAVVETRTPLISRLRRARSEKERFSAMMRYFIDEVWQVDLDDGEPEAITPAER